MTRRLAAVWSTVSSAPWRRAPWLLWRNPGVVATVVGACAVMAAAASSVPLFASSVGTAAVAFQAEERCGLDTGATMSIGATPADLREPAVDPFRPLSRELGPSTRWLRLQLVPLIGSDSQRADSVSIVTGDGAIDHVERLDGESDGGLWITDRAADVTGLGVGDVATVGTVSVPVSAIYRDLSGHTVAPFWCSNVEQLLIVARGGDLVRPPPMLIADPSTFADILEGLDIEEASGTWEAPLRDGLTIAGAEMLASTLACRQPRSAELAWCADGQPLLPRRSGGLSRDPVPARDDADFVQRFLGSSLPFLTTRAAAIRTAVGSGIWPVAAFATLAGAGLVAASASLWFERRRREVQLLHVRGVSPAGIAGKAVLELSLPAALGAAIGFGTAHALVVRLGPSSVLEPGAVREAATWTSIALIGAWATVAIVVGWRVRALDARPARRRWAGWVPWELPLVWATVTSYESLGSWGVPVGRGASVSRVDVWGLLFPVLFLVTTVAVLGRLLGLAVGPLLARSRSWPSPLYLVVRRVARHRGTVVGLVAAAAVAAGVLGYATTMNRSLQATLGAKATTFVGSDVAVRVLGDGRFPADLVDRSTEVGFHETARLDDGRGTSVTVEVIDPETFARAVHWDATFASAPLAALLDRLAVDPASGAAPAIVVGASARGVTEVAIVDGATHRITIDPITGVDAFPGMKRTKGTVFVAGAALAGTGLEADRVETWIAGDRTDSIAALDRAGLGFEEMRRLDEVADRSSFLTVTWTFSFLRSLGVAAGLLVIGGVAVYLDARRRDRLLGYAFLVRMGFGRREHRRSLFAELVASVLVGCWAGAAFALAAAQLAHGRIDPVPTFRPGPLLRPDTAVLAGLAVGSLVLVAVSAVVAQRRIDRDDPAEVLRAGL